jgi:hypothetical protein
MKSIYHIPSPLSLSFTFPFPLVTSKHCNYFTIPSLLLIFKLIFKGMPQYMPMWVYFTLVLSTPSITLSYPFASYPLFSITFNRHPYILYLSILCYTLLLMFYHFFLFSSFFWVP